MKILQVTGAGQQRHARAARQWPEDAVEEAAQEVEEDLLAPEAIDDSDADPVNPLFSFATIFTMMLEAKGMCPATPIDPKPTKLHVDV